MNAADTSVAVAAAQPWHEAHEEAVLAVGEGKTRLVAHAAVEAYSVLTRLPPPQRATPADARAYLVGTFALPFLALTAAEYDRVLQRAAAGGIAGGAVYDAVVGAAARQARATLVTLDRRAIRAYEAVGAEYQLLA